MTPKGPAVVLGSAVKRVDRSIADGIEAYLNGRFAPGAERCGLSDGGTDLVINPRFAQHALIVEARRAMAAKADNRVDRVTERSGTAR